MNNKMAALYIFKYTALDINNKQVIDFFVAESLEDCRLFLSMIGYKNIDVAPLKQGEAPPDLNKSLDLKNIGVEFGNLSNYIKYGASIMDSIIRVGKECNNTNRNIYFRIAYSLYKGDPLSVAMKKLGPVIPEDIINEISLGESGSNLSVRLANIIRKYAQVKKPSFFSKLFKKKTSDNNKILAANQNDNLKGIEKKPTATENSTLFPFKYHAKNENNKKVRGFFNAESIEDCKRFLEIQGYTDIVIEPRKSYDIEIVLSKKVKVADLAFDLTQLSTYIKAGIPLVEGVTILSKQARSPASKNAYELLVYDLLKGYSLSAAMEKQEKAFPKLLINMIKSAEMTGDLPTILDDMADYYEDVLQTRKAMKSAMTYPAIVLVLAVAVLAFMLIALVPQFISLYESNGATLPSITLTVIAASNFMQNYYIHLIIGIILFGLIFFILYKKVFIFRKYVQIIIMKMPAFGNIIIYNEVYNLTKTFSSLINHGVFITDSMEILSQITNNEVYKEIIANTLSNLAKGENISNSFKGNWAFPTVAYHMLVTGENTGQLGLMMEKVSEHYQQLHKSMVDQLKSLIEPAMILIVAGIVGVILLSIITPMFDIYSQIQ